MVVNIQAYGQTYKKRSEESTGKSEWTEYTDKKEKTSIYTRSQRTRSQRYEN